MSEVQARITRKLTDFFNPKHLEIINESYKHHVPEKSETHFLVIMVSDKFNGVSRIDRQRQMHSCLDFDLKHGVHALSQKLFTPVEWQNLESKNFSTPNCHTKK